MKSVTLLLVVACCLASATIAPRLKGAKHSVQQTPPAGLTDFLTGLVKGLEENSNSPGACSGDLVNANNDVMAVSSDVQRIVGGDEMAILQLITDVQALYTTLAGSNSDCHWSALIAEFKSLATSAGQEQILKNVMGNMGAIFSDAEDLANCPTNWVVCGYDVAQIFSMVFNWKIQVPQSEFNLRQASTFLSGFISGIETPGSDGTCVTDVEGLSGLADNIIADVEKAFGGNIAAALEAFTDIKKLLSDVEGFNGDCDLSGLVSALENLGTTAGWVAVAKNFIANLGTIESDASAFTTCTTSPGQCGYSLGEILRLTLGWSLGPTASLQSTPEGSWFEGFLQGLQSSPNASNECVSNLNAMGPVFQNVISDLENVATDFTLVFQLISDAKTLLADFEGLNSPCNISDLLDVLQSLSTSAGINTLINNFKLNVGTIMQDAPAIMNCSASVTTCGENVGVILRLVLGWSI